MATFFDRMNGGNTAPQNPFSNFQNTLQRFNEFRRNMKGNPQEWYNQMMNSGAISKEQYDQVNNAVQQFMRTMGGGQK